MSFLSEKYKTQSVTADFGSTTPGIALVDLDAMETIYNAEERGVVIDTQAITEFMLDQGADPEHFQTSTIGLYGPSSPLGRTDTTTNRLGYVEKDLILTDEIGYQRSLLMALRYDPLLVSEELMNFTLRHEIGHLLYEGRVPLYNRKELSVSVRIGALASTMTALSSMPDMFTRAWIRHQALVEGVPTTGILGIYAGISAAALYSAAVVRRPGGLLHRIDAGERKADAFAREHKDFYPIKFVSPAE